MSLLNPGTMTEYSGPSRSSSRRSRGTVRVRDPAFGFFIAGSSIDTMNGIYGRVRSEHIRFLSSVNRPVRLAYRHDKTGWLMCLVDIDPAELESDEEDDDVRYGFKEPCDMQWRFIDDKGINRFRHKGDTIIPGAGIRWKHIPLPKPFAASGKSKERESDYVSSSSGDDDSDREEEVEEVKPMALDDVPLNDDDEPSGHKPSNDNDDGAIVEVKEEEEEYDEDELPWQVIALLDRSVLEDLRFSSACRDEKVSRALKGLDVEQPPESSTVEGFLEAEKKVLRCIESGITSETDGDDDNNEYSPAPQGWLYRVTAEAGVELYTAPSDSDDDDGSDDSVDDIVTDEPQKKVGMRSKDDFVRIVDVKGRWLCLSKTEPPLRDVPLAVGDSVRVTSGHYRGEKGEITKAMNVDSREVGVHLKGYTGTGFLHVSNLVRDGPHPSSRSAIRARRNKRRQEAILRREERRRKREARERERAIMRQYYGDMYADYLPQYYNDDEDEESDNDTDEEAERLAGNLFGSAGDDEENEPGYDDDYSGDLWTPLCDKDNSEPLLVRLPDHAVASLTTGAEKEGAGMFDRPFEPRLEGELLHSAAGDESDDDDDDMDLRDDDNNAMHTPSAVPSVLISSSSVQMKQPIQEDNRDEYAIGSVVCLRDLKSAARYNGRFGVVVTKPNAEGRYGVRLNPPKEPKSIDDCNKNLLLLSKNLCLVKDAENSLDISSHLDDDEKDHARRAARVLNVQADAIGIGNKPVDLGSGKYVLDSLLRNAERASHPHRPPVWNASAQKMQSDSLQEAKKAHAALSCGIEKIANVQDELDIDESIGPSSSLLGLSPCSMIEGGLLGERAKAALQTASSDKANFMKVESGLTTLRSILKDEQARLLRSQAGGAFVPIANPVWKLEQAEKEAYNTSIDNKDHMSSNDCLLIRLAIIHILFESMRLSEAREATKYALELYPHSSACNLWHGRCLIGEGHRIDSIKALNNCVTLGPHSGPGGVWAHREGVNRLRSLKRTLKCEYRARDAYERGNFASAAKIYGEMMAEYDNYASDDKWGRAEALVARAACHRRDRDLKSALADCERALSLFPRYSRALFRRALCLLEDQRPTEALAAFEQLLRVDRNWPNLLDWLIRAVAQAKRQEANGGAQGETSGTFQDEGDPLAGNKDYYAVLGVSTDATEAQLKRAYRLMSLKVHPDKKGGSAAAFHLVAEAFETLSDAEKRQLYDDGVDVNKKRKKKDKDPYADSSSESEDEDGNKKKSLREEVERRYFPDHFKFWPFGDPFVNKRRHQARKRKQEEQEKARQERMKKRGGQQPPSHPWWQGHQDWDL